VPDLLPCPFCGSTRLRVDRGCVNSAVICESRQKADPPDVFCTIGPARETYDEAVDAWNDRSARVVYGGGEMRSYTVSEIGDCYRAFERAECDVERARAAVSDALEKLFACRDEVTRLQARRDDLGRQYDRLWTQQKAEPRA